MKPMQPVIVLVIALVVAAAAGYGGYYYRGTQIPTRGGFAAGAAGARGGAAGSQRGANGGGRVTGQIISASDTSLTVKLADGSSKIVIISGQTSINKAATATTADLKSGTTIAVFGMTNADGSVTAQSIQLNPMTPPSASPAAK